MEGIINNPLSGQEYIQYGKFTFKNETDKIFKVDPATVDMDKMVRFDTGDNVTPWKRFFSDIALSRSPVADVKKEVDAETETVINGFFDGTVSEEELSDAFQSLAEKFSSACKDAGYPIPLGWDKGITQTFTDTFYGEFRRKILDAAVQRNFQEGKQYITGLYHPRLQGEGAEPLLQFQFCLFQPILRGRAVYERPGHGAAEGLPMVLPVRRRQQQEGGFNRCADRP